MPEVKLIRVVRMTFYPEEIDNFLALFEEIKWQIRSFKGCEYLELWQDYDKAHVFASYSIWSDRDALEVYRNSPLFRKTWKETKALFKVPAVAFSFRKRMVV